MKRSSFLQNQDMLLLKWPVLLLLIALLVSAAWYGGAHLYRESNQAALLAARANRAQGAASVQRIEGEGKTVRNFIDRYRQLVTAGSTGEEDRLELMETVNSIRARHALYPVQLDIEPRAILPLAPNHSRENPGNDTIAWQVSRIRLNLPLLHEEDLFHLLDGLGEMKRGIFVTEECSLKRTGSDAGNERPAFQVNLSASCKILWLTVKREEADSGQGKGDTQREREEP